MDVRAICASTPPIAGVIVDVMRAIQPSIPAGRIRLSVDEYMELPNDGKRYQILDGELDVTPSPSIRHQRISRDLGWFLVAELKRRELGEVFYAPVDVVLDRHNIVQPDLLFVSNARAASIGAQRIEGAPDLVVEILSAGSRRTDVITKSELYARFGVQHYWIVDPELDRIEVYRLEDRGYELVAGAQSPAELVVEAPAHLRLPLAEIFG